MNSFFSSTSIRRPSCNLDSIRTSVLVLSALLASNTQTYGIGMRHDVQNVASTGTDNPYVQLGSQFDSVVRLSWTTHRGSFNASGTLVSSDTSGEYKILTAAHVIDGSSGAAWPDGIIDASQYTVEFGDNADSITHAVSIPRANIAVQPRWAAGDPVGTGLLRGAGQFDVAVLTFSSGDLTFGSTSSLPDAYGLATVDSLGETATIVGFGRNGLGDDFARNKDSVRRAGHNVVDKVDAFSAEANDGHTIRADFDPGSFPEDRNVEGYFGTVQDLEASTGNGDSGGPLLLHNGRPMVAGVLHGGYNHFANADPSEYGDVGVWASVNEPINKLFLQANGVAYHGFGVAALPAAFPTAAASVPEPASSLMLLFAFLGMQLRSRRRTK